MDILTIPFQKDWKIEGLMYPFLPSCLCLFVGRWLQDIAYLTFHRWITYDLSIGLVICYFHRWTSFWSWNTGINIVLELALCYKMLYCLHDV